MPWVPRPIFKQFYKILNIINKYTLRDSMWTSLWGLLIAKVIHIAYAGHKSTREVADYYYLVLSYAHSHVMIGEGCLFVRSWHLCCFFE